MSRTPQRSRRPSEEVRSRLLEAARELFAARGYEATTTKEISATAGVSERLLFSNFGSKAELFELAALAPFAELIAGYESSWKRESPDSTPETRIEAFVDGLYELARENRALLRSGLASGSADGPEADLLDRVAQTLQGLDELAGAVRESRGYGIDPPVSVAAAAAMVFGMALLDDLLFPAGTRRPSRDRLTAEMTQMMVHGVMHRGGDLD